MLKVCERFPQIGGIQEYLALPAGRGLYTSSTRWTRWKQKQKPPC